MKASVDELLQRLPGPLTATWPEGERFVAAMAHGTMSVELYVPVGSDPQTPHGQDELYFIHAGHGRFDLCGHVHDFRPGDAFFVPAGMAHRFVEFSEDFATWVVFWGPFMGETSDGGPRA
jgi:mannose-6-phosphate isomerase-like protein (cupin superfamily)